MPTGFLGRSCFAGLGLVVIAKRVGRPFPSQRVRLFDFFVRFSQELRDGSIDSRCACQACLLFAQSIELSVCASNVQRFRARLTKLELNQAITRILEDGEGAMLL